MENVSLWTTCLERNTLLLYFPLAELLSFVLFLLLKWEGSGPLGQGS